MGQVDEGPKGFWHVLAERIANVDRRIEESGRKIEERLSRHADHQDRHMHEIKNTQKETEQRVHDRIDGIETRHVEAEAKVGARITDIERTVQMLKGGVGVLIAMGGLAAIDRLLG